MASRSRGSWRRRGRSAEPLVRPPALPAGRCAPRPQTSAQQKLDNLFGNRKPDPVGHQEYVGIEGSKRRSRAEMVKALALGGSTLQEGLTPQLMPLVYGMCFQLVNDFTNRMMHDLPWSSAIEAAVQRLSHPLPSGRAPCICVLGLGTCLPALVAARCGADVLWVERIQRFAQCARQVAERNGLERRIKVLRVKTWDELKLDHSPVDAVVTEELSDDLLEDGLLPIARHAAAHLLPRIPSASAATPILRARFLPAHATIVCALLSLRVTEISGFDLRAFNAFRSNKSVFVDIEHLTATDRYGRQRARLLSRPVRLFDFDLERPDTIPAQGRTVEVEVEAASPGILNALVCWCELDLDHEAGYSFGPRPRGEARPFWLRARGQRVSFLGYERQLRVGERVVVVASHDEEKLNFATRPEPQLEQAGTLVLWPQVNSLAYHWPMISDEGRNSCFDRALRAAIKKMCACGRPPHVLDIGSGSGLLAMMAARAGAGRVSALEMVPSLAAAAEHIVNVNGYGKQVNVIPMKSVDMHESKLEGKADLLVCEIVDDQLLGEGVLTSISDARKRLLTPNATVIPCGAVVYAQALELRPLKWGEFQREDMALFLYDQALCARASTGCKLQQLPPSAYKKLAPPLALFTFDWVSTPPDMMCQPSRTQLNLNVTQDGVLNAFLIYFHLRCDDDNVFSTGPDNDELTAWDQHLRYLPMEVRVEKGMSLLVAAEHDEQAVRVGLPQLRPEWVRGDLVGHFELLPQVRGQ